MRIRSLQYFVFTQLLLLIVSTASYKNCNGQILIQNYDSTYLHRSNKSYNILYFHFTGCGACKELEQKVFTDSFFIDCVNKEYNFFSINTLTNTGKLIKEKYKVTLHPTLIITDAFDQVLDKITGAHNVNIMTAFLKNAITDENLYSYNKLYQEGNQEKQFLYNYLYKLALANEPIDTILQNYCNLLSNGDLSSYKAKKVVYDFMYFRNKSYFAFQSDIFQHYNNNINQFYEHFDSTQVIGRLLYVCIHTLNEAEKNGNTGLADSAIQIIKLFENRGNLYLKSSLSDATTGMIMTKHLSVVMEKQFYKKWDIQKYRKASEKYNSLIWNDINELNNQAYIILKYRNKDASGLDDALKYILRSMKLNKDDENLYLLSLYYSVLNQKKKSLKYLNTSIQFAQKNGREHTKQDKLKQELMH